nr:CHAP domain-containing protein [Qipengyuania intermedia]
MSAYIQCAPYAREISGIEIYGDARTWWTQAQARYETGNLPREGAVMAFRPHRSMQLGHVATVSRVLDSRRVLLDHANWSPIDGKRGQVEKNVLAIDVSPNNDWSEVRVWYAPIADVGKTRWPIEGFIYADERSDLENALRPQIATARPDPSKNFLSAFADYAD